MLRMIRVSAAVCLVWAVTVSVGAAVAQEPVPAKPAAVDAEQPKVDAEQPKVDAEPAEPAEAAEAEKPKADAEDSLAKRQQSIADKYRQLDESLMRMVEVVDLTDPHRAELLRKVIAQSKDLRIEDQLAALVDQLRREELSRAADNQEAIVTDLQVLLELLLSEDRARRIESEKARIGRILKQVKRIIREQKGVQGRTAGGDSADRLAGDQDRLAKKTGDLADEMKEGEGSEGEGEPGEGEPGEGEPGEGEPGEGEPGEGEPGEGEPGEGEPGEGEPGEGEPGEGEPGEGEPGEGEPGEGEPGEGQPGGGEGKSPGEQEEQNPARKRIQAAQEKMEEAKKKLEEAKRDGAVEDQEKAIEELEQAKAELEEILRQLREEEIERMLALLEARFRKMLRLQQVVYEGTLRLDKVDVEARTHNHEIEARRLGSKENDIVLEADKALTLLQEDGTAVAFPEALRQVRLDMVQVSQRLAGAKVGEITQVIEEDIIAALEEMIEALQKAQEEMEDEPPPGEPPPPGPPQDAPLVDLLAEVRMIRALQMRVNKRTERYSRLVVEEQADDADLLEALDRLAEREARIQEITRDLDLGKNQ